MSAPVRDGWPERFAALAEACGVLVKRWRENAVRVPGSQLPPVDLEACIWTSAADQLALTIRGEKC